MLQHPLHHLPCFPPVVAKACKEQAPEWSVEETFLIHPSEYDREALC